VELDRHNLDISEDEDNVDFYQMNKKTIEGMSNCECEKEDNVAVEEGKGVRFMTDRS